MRKISIICLLALMFLSSPGFAQLDFKPVHGNCIPDSPLELSNGRRVSARKQNTSATDWNPEKVYRQLVVLVEFSDLSFKYADDPNTFYDRMFNEPGFNDGNGPGCVAEYYHDQSLGKLNLQFDVFGPIKVSAKAKPENPNSSTTNYGMSSFTEALNKLIEDHPGMDFSVYDWNGDHHVEQVVFIYAGIPGNFGPSSYGYIWPNTSSLSTITTPDSYYLSDYTSSGELWPDVKTISCGLGTMCHEFNHSLGLPDIYPTLSSAGYSVCDEWDVMDGGNFSNMGWCPPNFTPIERWLLGWVSFVDLDEPTSVTGMKPVSEGGVIYRVKHSESEWLLLENRQQRGWDAAAPGKGLVIYHVNYDASAWQSNKVNNKASKRRFELVHADNMDYDAWDRYIETARLSTHVGSGRMNSRLLSTSPYPWKTDSTSFVNSELTDTSVPSSKMHEANEKGTLLLNKPITNIRTTEEGLVSFDFMGGEQTGIRNAAHVNSRSDNQFFDLQGRRLAGMRDKGFYIQRRADGITRKYFNKRDIY